MSAVCFVMLFQGAVFTSKTVFLIMMQKLTILSPFYAWYSEQTVGRRLFSSAKCPSIFS